MVLHPVDVNEGIFRSHCCFSHIQSSEQNIVFLSKLGDAASQALLTQGETMKFTAMIKTLKKHGILSKLTPKMLRSLLEEDGYGPPDEIEEWDAMQTAYTVLHVYYAHRVEEGLKDGYIQHSYRFGKETDDVVAELSTMIGEPPLYVLTNMGDDLLYVTRDDGEECEIDCGTNGFSDVVDYFEATLKARKHVKRFFYIDNEIDGAYLCLTREQFVDICKIWQKPASKPVPTVEELTAEYLKESPEGLGFMYRAQRFEKIKRFDLALSDYDAVDFLSSASGTHKDIELAKSLFSRAKLQFAFSRYGECVDDCTQLLSITKADSGMFMIERNALLQRAKAFTQLKESNAALADFSELIARNEWDPDAYFFRASVHDLTGNDALADNDRKKAQELGYRPDLSLVLSGMNG